MRRCAWTALIVVLLAAGAVPAAHADPAWTCGASAGWLAAGQRTDAPGVGGDPCPTARADAQGASAAAGSVSPSGSLSVDGGSPSRTTDTRTPQAVADLKSVEIRNGDGLDLVAQRVRDTAQGSCDAGRNPTLTSSSSLGSVTLNGRPIDTSRPYSEPGVGVNGAPLFGQLAITFGGVVQSGDTSLVRRAIHVTVTDRNGAVVFEAVGAEVAVGRDGPVCDPPPVCPAGTQPQDGKCVQVQVAPLPPPPPPAPSLPPVGTPSPAPQPKGPRRAGCRDGDARIGQVSNRRLATATLCLLNAARKKHHLRRLRMSAQLTLAAARHARNMIARRYFAHDEPAGPSFLDRVLHSGYLERYGRWRIGEDLGWGWGSGGTPRALVAAWLRSPPHRRNILNPRFHDVGIAVRAGTPRKRSVRQPATYVIDFGGFQLVGRG